MKAICIIPKGQQEGNLIWKTPYIYPKDLLRQGIADLNIDGFLTQELDEEVGIAFRSDVDLDETQLKLKIAFPWMDITFYDDEAKVQFKEVISDYAIVALPIDRLRIESAIITHQICLFPPGEMWISNVRRFNGTDFSIAETEELAEGEVRNLRDFITSKTKISIDVFQRQPIIVFTIKYSYAEYKKLTQDQDNDLIRVCSEKAEEIMDILKFYEGDYILPEALPAKAGIWDDHYSAMYIYFPSHNVGHIQSREVELKSFIKGIGMDFYQTDKVTYNSLLSDMNTELKNIAKHALRLNSLVMESDNETMKFAQIMILFEYIGDPYSYGNFKNMKSKFVATLATNKTEYHKISHRFLELTKGNSGSAPDEMGLRTQIVHMGKSIYQLLPNAEERKALFTELHRYTRTLIEDIIWSDAESWAEYDAERIKQRDELLIG